VQGLKKLAIYRNDLKTHLHRNGTRVIKFFLHLSEKEQHRQINHRFSFVSSVSS
jgi:polyphosphate kinase 2 (PPK2 family)